jgi:prepilin-type processing-associated H-X9-DG protein
LCGDKKGVTSKYRGNVPMGGISDPGGTRVLDASTNVAGVLQGIQACAAKFNAGTDNADRRGYRWTLGVTGFTMFNTIQTPNDTFNGCRYDCSPGCFMDNGFSYPASSQHSGGVNCLMSDGSVRFIKNSVNRASWWAIGTSHGEVVDARQHTKYTKRARMSQDTANVDEPSPEPPADTSTRLYPAEQNKRWC